MKKRHHKRIWVVNQFELGLGEGAGFRVYLYSG